MKTSEDMQDVIQNNWQGRICSVLTWFALGTLLFLVSVAAVLKLVDIKIDYPAHIGIAARITWGDLCHPISFLKGHCYPVWHVLTWMAMHAFRCGGRSAAAIVTGGCVMGIWTCAVWHFLRKHRDTGNGIAWAASVLLMLVMPIWLPFFNPSIVVGQGGPNVLHNPTNIMVKLLAFPCFLWYAAIMDDIGKGLASRMGVLKIVALSLFVLLTALAKPSFVQMFLPAMLILSILKLIKYKKAAIRPVAVVTLSFVPVVSLMALQMWLSFYHGGGSGVSVAFLKVWRHYSPNVFVSLVVAILFPAIVLLWSIRARKVSTADVLAWIMYGVANAEYILLMENGIRCWHGNFSWSVHLAQFFLWFTSIDRFVSLASECVNKIAGTERKLWFGCASVACALHLASGLCYLWRVMVLGIWL